MDMKPDNDLVQLLASLDLKRNEALTYAALLELDSVSIRKIAVHTGINRGTTYEALKRLVIVGLASVNQRGEREYYTAESPEKIYDLIRDRRRDLLDASESAKTVVSKLLAHHPRNEGRPLVRYYEGDDGIVTILKDVLQTCRDLKNPGYFAFSSSRVRQYLYRSFPQFTERRIAEGIAVKVIAVGEGGEPAEASERKWLVPDTRTDNSSYTIIYGDKVAVVSVSNDLIPYGVVTEDAGVAAMQRLLFNQLWKYL
jgi:sugar-specific transcriptional regulator TrmB